MIDNETLIDIKSMNMDALDTYIQSFGEKSFRATQRFDWLHNKKVTNFSDMRNLSKAFIETLSKSAKITQVTLIDILTSKDDDTKKYLFRLEDGHMIETVLMRYSYGYSICISSQVGCRMGCTFCASTLGGLARDLTPSEMLEQVYAIERAEDELCHGVVVMGIGEPFDNFDNLITWIHLINHPKGRNLGQRHITVSTSGVVAKIKAFADLNLQVNLAISLHSTNNNSRSELMPINKKYPIEALIESCRYYIHKTNRRITFEYTLISGTNDSENHARSLAHLVNHMLCHVNLIPINGNVNKSLEHTTTSVYQKPDIATQQKFKSIIEKTGIPVTIRRSLGSDIDASCGQLRHQHMKDKGAD
ncbi:MAG: 23S rRNA (adenine(2503)-C(2))-methyltransferase RlmN [Vallitaleaceae bacterium]|jgi:23S rRNA (adenine2503-C2)-methyltransferase|nr:23S rRNA (adenine(2503)-C(2))-methyltransferase RlmN [Vallitaleaceae bacterium]